MHVAIIGIGAMGSLFAARLHASCDLVMCGDWPEQVESVRRTGLTLIDQRNHATQHQVRIADDVSEVGRVDLAIILVKSHKTEQAAALAEQILLSDGLVLTLQNGLGHAEKIAAVVAPVRVILGSTAHGAMLVQPGVVRHAGVGLTHITRPDSWTPGFDRLLQLFEHAQIEIAVVDDVRSVLWSKLVINAGINPLSALLRVTNGYLAEDSHARQLMMQAAEEAAQVARAQNIPLDYANAGQCALEVARATADNHSSMLQDVLRGAPTEIEAITGALVACGEKLNVPTPVNALLLRLMRAGAEKIEIAEVQQLLR